MMTDAAMMNAVTVRENNETSRIIKPAATTIISMILLIACHSLNVGGFNIVLINRLIIVITLDGNLNLFYQARSRVASRTGQKTSLSSVARGLRSGESLPAVL